MAPSSPRLAVAVILLASALAILVACSGGKPSAGDGRTALQERIRSESGGRITLVRFEKTDAQQGEVFGVPLYEMQWTAEIEFTQDCKWVTGLFGVNAGFQTRIPPAGAGKDYWGGWMENTQYPGVLVKAGDRASLSGVVTFRKTEKGWRPGQCTVAKYELRRGG